MTIPEKLDNENFRLTATTQNDDVVTVIVCGAPDAFEAAKTLGSVGKPSHIVALLLEIDAERLQREMGVTFVDDDGDDDDTD